MCVLQQNFVLARLLAQGVILIGIVCGRLTNVAKVENWLWREL